MAAKDTAIVPVSIQDFALARINPDEIRQLVRENLGNNQIDPVRDLDRIKIPTGGGVAWTVPSLSGDEMTKEIEGVIIHWQDARAFWPDAFSGGTPPDCVSEDGEKGVGNPGGDCIGCPKAEWGSSDKEGNSQACKSIMRLFVVQPGSLLPVVIALPPTSIRPARQYFLRLVNSQLSALRVMTRFTLEAATNQANIKYAKVVLTYVGPLSADDQKLVESYRNTIAPLLIARGASADEVQ